MKTKMKAIKTYVYGDGKGNYFPAVLMRDRHNSCIVPMGRPPIKGNMSNMSIQDFERILERFGYQQIMNISANGNASLDEAYRDFNLIMQGMDACKMSAITEHAMTVEDIMFERRIDFYNSINKGR